MHLPLCAKRVRELCMLEPDVMIILQRALLEGGVDLDTDDRTDEDASPGGHTGYTREPGGFVSAIMSCRSELSRKYLPKLFDIATSCAILHHTSFT